MSTSNEELQKKKNDVAKLREQLEEEERKTLEHQYEARNDVLAAQLDAEAAHLRAELAAAKAANRVGPRREAVATVTATAKEEMEAAVAQQKALEAGNTVAEPATTQPKGSNEENKEK